MFHHAKSFICNDHVWYNLGSGIPNDLSVSFLYKVFSLKTPESPSLPIGETLYYIMPNLNLPLKEANPQQQSETSGLTGGVCPPREVPASSPPEVTLADLSAIRQTAERLNPGVGSRVSAADYESIVSACWARLGLPVARRLQFTPAPSHRGLFP